jgi:coenzyme F420-reducing hydrogenase delta subunit/ferredoxin
MNTKATIGVLLATDAALNEALPLDQLTAAILERGWVLKTVAAEHVPQAIEAFEDLCRNERPAGVVIAGPTLALDRFPRLAEMDGQVGLRPVPVNLAECCAWTQSDPDAVLAKALRLLEIAAARALIRQPIELLEKPVQKRALVLGSDFSAAAVCRELLANGIEVTALAQGATPKSSMPDGVTTLTETRLHGLRGFPGGFRAKVKGPQGFLEEHVGAVVVALEAEYAPPELQPEILNDARVQRLHKLAGNSGSADFNGDRSVIFLLDLSGPTPREAAAEARRLAERAVEAGLSTTVFFRNMAVNGRTGQLEYDHLRSTGARLIRYDRAPEISATADGIKLSGHDMVLGQAPIEVTADRLVLSHEAVPAPLSAELAKLLHLPLDQEGFLQPANVRHLPVGSPRRGVFFTGTGHQDLSGEDATQEAKAVAGQVVALLSANTVLTPKELVLHNRDRCAMCLTCLRSCYHGAIDLAADGSNVEFEPGACWECGLCASVCPQKAITRLFSPEAELQVAVETAGRPIRDRAPVVAFCCQNSAVPALEQAGRLGLQLSERVIPVEVPCAGYVSQTEILGALNAGAERVLVVACHEDNCRSCRGSTSAHGRSGQVRRDLESLDLGADRVSFHSVAANESHRLAHILADAAGETTETTPERKAAHG